ncbi:MAG: Uma2 family endonuclease [Planctomycetaceae bacterium]
MTTIVAPPFAEPQSLAALQRAINFPESRGDQHLTLWDVDWDAYKQIAEGLTGRHVRLTYENGRLDLMTISSKHGILCRLFTALIRVLAEELDVPILACGDMTCENEPALKALEPDECFYIQNELLVRGKDDLDLTVDPPPDLAVEIELSRARPNRMSIYARLRVPEVWRYKGKTLTCSLLTETGHYTESDFSRAFPQLPLSELLRFVERRTQTDENSLVRSFREWVRTLQHM